MMYPYHWLARSKRTHTHNTHSMPNLPDKTIKTPDLKTVKSIVYIVQDFSQGQKVYEIVKYLNSYFIGIALGHHCYF